MSRLKTSNNVPKHKTGIWIENGEIFHPLTTIKCLNALFSTYYIPNLILN